MFDPSKLQEMMQQAAHMQTQMQNELRQKSVVGQAGGGMVQIGLNGLYEVQSVKVDPSVVDAKDASMLEDLIRASLTQALVRVEDVRMDHARHMAGAMGIPGGLF